MVGGPQTGRWRAYLVQNTWGHLGTRGMCTAAFPPRHVHAEIAQPPLPPTFTTFNPLLPPRINQNVVLEATLLKPQMCIPGADHTGEKPTSVRSRVPLLCSRARSHCWLCSL